ncbi:MAG: DegT/DnrJ/EryC1/StrS family aminotransferase [Candidatus Omnitrophica bacterium]|nr:DegT/DnrJ/EryC1/StrS family aminotransferase [Candidatus Omnitrophota bacterium]
MKIQMTDLRIQYENAKKEIDSAIREVIEETGFILGKQVSLFEEEAAKYFGAKYAIGVASGTDALILSLAALGIDQGDEVITTPFTFIATAEAVSRVGAKPVFCDIDRLTYNIDPDKIEEKVTPRTKALLPVHLYGMPCRMDKITAIADKHNLKLIEDCAQSFGSEYKSKKTGVFGDCGCLSFFPAKTLGCFGDGGMILTNSDDAAQKTKMLRNHGSNKKYYYGTHGFNSRLDTMQAAILRVKLKYIDTWINKRIENAKYYSELLRGCEDIVTPDAQAPSAQGAAQEYKHTFNYYTVRIKNNRREDVQKRLKERSVPSAIYYPLSLHLQEVYQELGYKKGDFPVAESAQDEVLSLPMYPELDKEQIRQICEICHPAQHIS